MLALFLGCTLDGGFKGVCKKTDIGVMALKRLQYLLYATFYCQSKIQLI